MHTSQRSFVLPGCADRPSRVGIARFAVAAPFAAALLAAGPLYAAGAMDAPPPPPIEAEMSAGQRAIKNQQWNKAVERLEKAVQIEPTNADARNLLGFAYRHVGRLDESLASYNEALRLNPKHRGAHEYLGQLLLMRGDKAGAAEHLAALSTICGERCEEYRDLKKAIDTAGAK